MPRLSEVLIEEPMSEAVAGISEQWSGRFRGLWEGEKDPPHLVSFLPSPSSVAGKSVLTARRCVLMIAEQYRSQAVWRWAIAGLAHGS
jgi:hypothetical protein